MIPLIHWSSQWNRVKHFLDVFHRRNLKAQVGTDRAFASFWPNSPKPWLRQPIAFHAPLISFRAENIKVSIDWTAQPESPEMFTWWPRLLHSREEVPGGTDIFCSHCRRHIFVTSATPNSWSQQKPSIFCCSKLIQRKATLQPLMVHNCKCFVSRRQWEW